MCAGEMDRTVDAVGGGSAPSSGPTGARAPPVLQEASARAMDAKDWADTEEFDNILRFRRFEQLWYDIAEAERKAHAAARLDWALRVCCHELEQPMQTQPRVA
jgi:hypothetical protein